MTPNDLIATGYRTSQKLLHRMTDDLSPADFRHQPVPGANSAAWVVGHLAATVRRTAGRLGADLPAADFTAFTVTGKEAGEQADLGDPAELLRLFDAGIEAVIEAVKAIPLEKLDGPPAAPTPFSANLGEALAFGAMHVAIHAGQLSTVRRSLGKPPTV